MFCRYCGFHIPDDSVFCPKCGKRLGPRSHPRLEKIVATLRLKTPYPYFAILLVVFVAWVIAARQSHADYSHMKWSIEAGKNLDIPESNTYLQNLSLILENTGSTPVAEVPVEVRARIEPAQPAEVDVDLMGRRLVIMSGGKPIPLVPILSDTVAPGAKRRYDMGVGIQAQPTFKVTVEVRTDDSRTLLASYVVQR